ncbi:MAG: hypothetical protein K6T83_01365 [Alicyclobacillus sp.]|nr:hypothetical protein [Alicyclobacillus sp.]
MGYTIGWDRAIDLDPQRFSRTVEDFKKVLPHLQKLGIELVGESDANEPILTDTLVRFNGKHNCGHERFHIGNAVELHCWQGCDGEPFIFPLHQKPFFSEHLSKIPPYMRIFKGWEPKFLKTLHKPYDLAAKVFLLIARHHFGPEGILLEVGRGEMLDAMAFCQLHLGFGEDYVKDWTKSEQWTEEMEKMMKPE